MPQTLSLTRPDDWHVHFRDGAAMASVAADTARQFARAIVMPNLRPPVVTVAQAEAYRDRIRATLPKRAAFQPLMTLYLTDNMPPAEIEKGAGTGVVTAVKYYPAGATTNSDSGVTDIRKCDAVLRAMQDAGMPLLVHGEVTDPGVDVFDREAVFVEGTLTELVSRYPGLKIVVEHITTRAAAAFVERAPSNVAATITAHHLLMNRNAIFAGGIRPHHYCLPVLKREQDRRVLLTGEVPKEADKAKIEEAAKGVLNVREVVSEIRIAGASSMAARGNDSLITTNVKTLLLNNDGKFHANHVKVVTEANVVYLMGLLTQAEADAAVEIARKGQGVLRVVKVFEYVNP